MRQLLDKTARAYRDGGVMEVGRRAYNRYIYPHVRKTSLYTRYHVRQEQKRLDALVTDLEHEGIGTHLTRQDLMAHRTSDTLFVLASGGSINDITDSQWGVIDRHDSIGLNRWPIHEFVPTYYVFELPGEYPEMRQTFCDLLEYRKDAYAETPTIIKDLGRMPEIVRSSDIETHVAGDLLLSRDSAFLEFNSGTEPQRRLLKWLHSHGYFSPSGPFDLIYRVRASISYILHLAALLGYERIVLCGVDMVNSEYFFMEPEYRTSDVPIPEVGITNTDRTHPTNDPEQGARITLEDLIYLMDDVVLQPSGIELYVENTISALHPRVPAYSYENDI